MKRLQGLLALLLLLGIIAGAPMGLIAVGSALDLPPIGEWGQALTRPDRDGTFLVAALLLVAWVAWALLVVSIVLEAVAWVRNTHPPAVPGLRLPQMAAHGLIATVALLFTASPVAVAVDAPSVLAAGVQAPVTAARTAPAMDDALAAPSPADTTTQTATAATEAAPRSYTVAPGDTLWGIAESQLGDGARYKEIVALNTGRLQPDGATLGTDNWVYAGWELLLPPTDTPPDATREYLVAEGDTLWDIAQAELGDGDRYPEIVDATRGVVQPDGMTLTDPDVINTGWTVRIPTPGPAPATAATTSATAAAKADSDADAAPQSAAPQTGTRGVGGPAGAGAGDQGPGDTRSASTGDAALPAAAVEAPARANAADSDTATAAADDLTVTDAEDDLGEDTAAPLRTLGGIGALLAAGLLALWAGNRQLQRWRARPGQELEPLDPRAMSLVSELGRSEDPDTRVRITRALRLLAAGCAQTGQPLPRLAAIVAHPDADISLYLTEAQQLPAPWTTGEDDGWVWSLPATEPSLADEHLADQPAPYPALVTLGHDTHAHVLVDLEQIGSLGVQGDPELVRDVVAAMALELGLSEWADDVTVTVVGGFAELEGAVGNGQIRYLPTAAGYLDDLERLATETHATLAAAAQPDLATARPAGDAAEVSAPEIVVFLSPPTDTQRDRLQQLLHTRPRAAIAAVTAGQEPLGPHVLELTGPDTAIYHPAEEPLVPQRIDDDSYRRLMTLLSSSLDDPRDEPATEEPWAEPELDALPDPPADLATNATATDADAAPTAPTTPAAAEPTAAEQDPAHHEPDDDASSLADIAALPAQGPVLQVLGDVQLVGVSAPAEPRKIALFTEVVAFLEFRPDSDPQTLQRELWPPERSPSQTTFNTTITKTRKWLGAKPDGALYLPKLVDAGGYRIVGVRTDWDHWQELVPGDPTQVSTEALLEAVRLIRGYPFSGARSRRYTWAIAEKEHIAVRVVAAARELARRLLLAGHYHDAMLAAEAGIRVMPQDQELWRIRLKAAGKAGDRGLVQALVDRFIAMSDGLGGDIEPDTEQLLTDLSAGPLRIAV